MERIAEKRLKICQSNKCRLYDARGEFPITFVKGKPACGACGCNAKWLTHSLSSDCSLRFQGKEPLWVAEMSEEEENKFREKTGIKNDH